MHGFGRLAAAFALAAVVAFSGGEATAGQLDYAFGKTFGDTGRGRDELVRPSGMAFSSDDLLAVAEGKRNTIQFYEKNGDWIRSVGRPRGEGRIEFKNPSGLAFDNTGRLWVADTGNDRVLVVTPQGALIKVVGESGLMDGEFRRPTALAYGGRRVYVADTGNKRVQIFDTAGELREVWNEWTVGGGGIKAPVALAWSDEGDGRLWVANEGSTRLLKLDMRGRTVETLDLAQLAEGAVKVEALFCDRGFDRLFVCDSAGNRVLVVSRGKLAERVDLAPGVRAGAMSLNWRLELYVADRSKGRILLYYRR